MYINLAQCIEFLGVNCFTPDQYTKLLNLLKDALDMCFSRASERQAKRDDEDYDEQVEEELEEEVCGHHMSGVVARQELIIQSISF